MPRLSHHAVFAIVFSLLLSAAAESAAPEARKLLGQGVHSLYQGRLFEAIEDFDVASIDLPQDPRIYFFRGVAKMRIGQRDDAIFDFQRDAQLEALLGRRDIGRSLERIQGYERFQIERYRLAARKLAQAGELLPPDMVVRNRRQDRRPENRVVVAEIPSEDELPDDAKDPFASDSNGLLGRGATEQNTNVVEPPRPELNNDSDVAAEFDDDAFGGEFEDDAAEENPFPVDPEIAEESNKADSSGSGAFGAVFRALTRSAIPGTTEQRRNVIEGLRETVPLPNGVREPSEDGFPEQSGDDSDPFGNDSDPFGSDDEPFGSGNAEMSDEEDPFGNDAPTDDGQGTDDATDDADPFADDADPFADEEDPFGN